MGTSRVVYAASFDDGPNQHGGFSTLALNADGSLLLGGFKSDTNASSAGEIQFHRLGVVQRGRAFVAQLPSAAVKSSTGPTVADESAPGGWIWEDPSWVTTVAVIPNSMGVGVALHKGQASPQPPYLAGFALLNFAGSLVEEVHTYPNQHRVTAMAASQYGDGFLLAGVGNVADPGRRSTRASSRASMKLQTSCGRRMSHRTASTRRSSTASAGASCTAKVARAQHEPRFWRTSSPTLSMYHRH